MSDDTTTPGEETPSTPLVRWWRQTDWFGDGGELCWRHCLWMAAAASVLLLPLLGAFGLWDPWETHYGEVGRQITERQDWISLWWGSHWEGAGGSEGSYFFSKPVLLMWMIALGIEVFGVNPWAVRLGVGLTAVVGVVVVYAFGCSVFRRRTGVLMAAVLATSPFWAMLGRQAQTDMPFVGTMTVGMCFFMMAVFGRDRDRRAGKFSQLLCASWIAVLSVPQISLVLMGLSNWRGPDIGWMEVLTAEPMLLVGAWGAVLIAAAVAAVVSLVWNHQRRHQVAWGVVAAVWGTLFAVLVAVLATGLAGASGDAHAGHFVLGWFIWGPTQAALYTTCLGVALYLVFDRPEMTRRRLYLLTFYAFIALATLAKGLLGFLLPGAVLFLYILINREWRMLAGVELLRGTLIFVAIAVPWYAAMLVRHHPGFWNRFFVHDHFQRFGSGVHSLSAGSFEHFIRWLGYGMFPWSALIPAALARIFSSPQVLFDDDRGRAVLLLLLWVLVGFTLFSLSSTTFHHYIFPVVPPLALLIGLTLDDLIDGAAGQPWPLYAVAAAIAAIIAWDLIGDPQQIKNLFTYRYDRNWDGDAWDGGFRVVITAVTAVIVAAMTALMVVRSKVGRRRAVALLVGGAMAMVLFCLNVYMPTISSTMSQQELWERYVELCDDEPTTSRRIPDGAGCQQPAIAFKLNWRGETLHTGNQVIPIGDDDDWDVFVDDIGDNTFFGIMQHSRFHGEFQRKLPDRFDDRACIVHDGNLKFVLAKVPCGPDDPARVDD